jgi:hypothetical protein
VIAHDQAGPTPTDHKHVERLAIESRRWVIRGELSIEINSNKQEDGDDIRGNPIHHEAKRRPPPRIGDESGAVLPQVLDAMAYETDHN